jgi:hypothetical protein
MVTAGNESEKRKFPEGGAATPWENITIEERSAGLKIKPKTLRT